MADQDWVSCFNKAYENALVHGTGFIKVTANSPKGLELSVVAPEDYHYIAPVKAEPTDKPKEHESYLVHGGLWIHDLFRNQRESKK